MARPDDQLGVDAARCLGCVNPVEREPVEDPAQRSLRRGDARGRGDLPGGSGPERGHALHELARGVGRVERRLDLLTLGGEVAEARGSQSAAAERVKPARWRGLTATGAPSDANWVIIANTSSLGGP